MKLTFLSLLLIAIFTIAPLYDAWGFSFASRDSIWRTDFSEPERAMSSGDQNSNIKNFQVLGKSTGIAYTRNALFRTDDNGESWIKMPLRRDPTQSIAQVYFTDVNSGWLLLADRSKSTLEIRQTSDGGNTWTATPVLLDSDELQDANLDDALLLLSTAAPEWQLSIPLQTSSNFRGSLFFSSRDNWHTWEVRSRWVGLNTPEEDRKSEVASGGWTLWTEGTCFAAKTGCVQETRLFRSGNEITPPQIKQLIDAERETAKRAVQTFGERTPRLGSPTRTSLNRGFDMCNSPTVAQMLTWWNNSPLYDMNIYMSGRNRACSAQPNLSASWVAQVSAMGWGLIPTVVGYQSPCTASTTTAKLSFDPVTAESQGRGEADIAVAAAINLGLTAGSILYYDMERYDETGSTPGCRTATTAFLKGWTDRLKELGYKSGVYGSPKNAQEDWMTLPAASKMDAIWMARWDNITSVWTYISFPTFPTNEWTNHQRIKQWQAPHNETWGGVTFNIDGNNSDGPVAGSAIAKNKNADFDGDGKTDLSVFRPETGVWYVLNSSNSAFSGNGFGLSSDIVAPGDYDGDGKTDFCVFRPADGVWHMMTKAGNYTSRQFGLNGDIPVPADYNGDGKTDVAVFRPSTGTWYISNSDSLGTYSYVQWGQSGDKPVMGDFDGDGKADVAVYRPSNGVWYVLRSSNSIPMVVNFGLATDLPAQGDFDADGKTDIAVFRPSSGVWYILRSSNGAVDYIPWGLNGDVPAVGDYDGDGKDDIAVFRPSNSVWYLLRSQTGFYAAQFGIAVDRPVPNAYLPQ